MGSASVQGKLWGAAPRDWIENEKFGVPFYQAVFDAVGLRPGTRLLDLGCGAGLALQLAAERGAQLAGLDAAEGLLAIARDRVPDADLRHGEIEELPFGDAMFDVVTSFNAVQFATDPVAALREARRVARPGATIALVTWGDPQRCETRTILTAIGGLLPPPPPGAGGPFALSAPGKLAELARSAGLQPGQGADVAAPFSFADLDSAVRIQISAGPMQRAIEHAGEERTRATLADAFGPYRRPDGSYYLHNEFRYLLATA